MTDYLDLAMRYGGFTSLDRTYLTHKLACLTDQQKLDFITPPPSVVNAYFAEIYQKQSPEAALAYFWELSQALDMLVDDPSFDEERPFVRLNLLGRALGFSFVNAQGLAQIFSEQPVHLGSADLFELAMLFPTYQVWEEEGRIFLEKKDFEALAFVEEDSPSLLTSRARWGGVTKLWGPSREDLLELAAAYPGQAYYAWSERTAILYLIDR